MLEINNYGTRESFSRTSHLVLHYIPSSSSGYSSFICVQKGVQKGGTRQGRLMSPNDRKHCSSIPACQAWVINGWFEPSEAPNHIASFCRKLAHCFMNPKWPSLQPMPTMHLASTSWKPKIKSRWRMRWPWAIGKLHGQYSMVWY